MIEVLAVERQRGVALHDPHHPGVGGELGALGQTAVDHQPARRDSAVAQAEAALQPAASLVDRTGGEGQVERRVTSTVLGKRHHLVARQSFPSRGECPGPAEHQGTALLRDGAQLPIGAFADGRRDLGQHDGAVAGIGHELGALDAVEEGQRVGPALGVADREGFETGTLDERGGTNGRIVAASTALRHRCGRSEAPEGQHAAQVGQLVLVHGPTGQATSRLRRR